MEPATRQYPLLLPPHFRALLSEIPRIRRLCRLAAVVFHSFQRTCRRRRRSHPSSSRNAVSGVREPEVGHPAGGELVEPADAVVHRHPPAPPGQDPQLVFQPLDRLGGDPDPDLRAGEKNPNPSSVACAACRIEDFSRFTFSFSRRSITPQTLSNTL